MDAVKTKLKNELNSLFSEGWTVLTSEARAKKSSENDAGTTLPVQMTYQMWYSKALPVVRQLLPERYTEFQEQYKMEKRKEIDFLTYTISDYLIGLSVTRGYAKEEVVNPLSAFQTKFQHQLMILNSAIERIDSVLTDIEGVLQYELFGHELDAADNLLKKKHLRAAGTLAGVSLETHLARVAANHAVKLTKKSPTISELNDALKADGILDTITWRLVQRLGDIRNLCAHAKEREPSVDEVNDLIAGTRKLLSSLF